MGFLCTDIGFGIIDAICVPKPDTTNADMKKNAKFPKRPLAKHRDYTQNPLTLSRA
jgi:hypothetical protein